MNPFLSLMTAWMQSYTASMMAIAEANAAMAAAMSRQSNVTLGNMTFGNITVYFPFGQGYSQDIDPNTNWILARSAGLSPGSSEALEFAAEFGKQQALVAELTEQPEGMATEAVEKLRATSARMEELRQPRS
ncbi:MAG: hypothetical protein AAGC79_17590 [Pseudomonadota bacterium]